jgi:hypothetical protein
MKYQHCKFLNFEVKILKPIIFRRGGVLLKRKLFICIKIITKFLLEIHWPFFMKGIHIEPTSAINETRLEIRSLEKGQSDKVKIIKSGMLSNYYFFLS